MEKLTEALSDFSQLSSALSNWEKFANSTFGGIFKFQTQGRQSISHISSTTSTLATVPQYFRLKSNFCAFTAMVAQRLLILMKIGQ